VQQITPIFNSCQDADERIVDIEGLRLRDSRFSIERMKGVSNKKALRDICIMLPMGYNRRIWIGIKNAELFAAADIPVRRC
jgi:hypothetical protein